MKWLNAWLPWPSWLLSLPTCRTACRGDCHPYARFNVARRTFAEIIASLPQGGRQLNSQKVYTILPSVFFYYITRKHGELLGSRAQHIQPIPFAMKNIDTIPVRHAAGFWGNCALISCFIFLFATGLHAQPVANGHNGSLFQGSSTMLAVPDIALQLDDKSGRETSRPATGLRSVSPFAGENFSAMMRKGLADDLPEPMDAREAFAVASAFLTNEDPDARPVNMYGEDSSLYDDFELEKTTAGTRLVPTGESYFWEVAFLNETDSLVHFVLIVGSEVFEFETYDVRDFPQEELPPIPLSELKSIPENFISSKTVLAAALSFGMDDLLFITELDGWFNIDYNLGSFYFEFPGLLDSESPVFWDVLFDGHAWDEEQDRPVWVEANFLVDAVTGNLLGKLVFSSEDDFHYLDFMDIYTKLGSEMLEINSNASLIQAFGREEDLLPDMPVGKSTDWMAVWFDADMEMVYMFQTRNGDIFVQDFFPLSDIPEEQRPPPGHFKPIDLRFGSVHALTTSMDNGLRQQLEQSPAGTSARVNYNLHSGYQMFPGLLDENSNPFWHLEVDVEAFNEEWQRVYHVVHSHLVDAVTGEHLGSVTETSAENGIELPARATLYQNYPNPFNPVTLIQWDLDTERHVTLSVFDLLGRKVAQPADGVYQAGTHSVSFDASGLSSGVYIYRLEAGGTVLHRSMTVVK
jgi:hypothetical protein